MLVVCSLLAMIFVLLHCHPATKKLCPHAEVMLAFRDHGIITTSSNKTKPNVTYTNRLVLVHHRNFLLIIISKQILFGEQRYSLYFPMKAVDW